MRSVDAHAVDANIVRNVIIIDKYGFEELNIETPIQKDDFVDLRMPIVQTHVTETPLNTTLQIAENTKHTVENMFNAIISWFQANLFVNSIIKTNNRIFYKEICL